MWLVILESICTPRTEQSGPDLPFAVQLCLQLLLHYYSHRHAKLCEKLYLLENYVQCNCKLLTDPSFKFLSLSDQMPL